MSPTSYRAAPPRGDRCTVPVRYPRVKGARQNLAGARMIGLRSLAQGVNGMPQPSAHPGMGARPIPAGTSFRVWAPFASNVSVAGEFNAWDTGKHELASEGNGYWSVDVPGAR